MGGVSARAATVHGVSGLVGKGPQVVEGLVVVTVIFSSVSEVAAFMFGVAVKLASIWVEVTSVTVTFE